MWKIALILMFTLVAVPVATFLYDEPLNALQWETLITLLYVYGIAAGICFIIGSLTDNYSQVDKLWSIIPVPYVWITAYCGEFEPRLLLMAILVTIWAIRLTYNFGRRGGYSWKFWTGEEDYRWELLRAKPGFEQNWKWHLFNFAFISGYQMGLILLFTLPALKSMGSTTPLIWVDYLLAAIMIGFVVIEFIADQQQYNYQETKYAQKRKNQLDEYHSVGFTHTGLWAYMRHPNYAAEQSIWIVFYLFSVVATGTWINWSIAGCLLLVLLFKGSSDFSEAITKEKYPLYTKYINEVGRFLPIKKKFKV